MLRPAWLIARNDLRRRLRSRAFVLQAIVGPMVLATVISLAFGGSFGFDEHIGVVATDRSELAAGVQRQLVAARAKGVTFEAVPDLVTARAKVGDEDLDAAIVIPAGFQDSLASAQPEPLGLVTDPGHQVGAAVARSVASGIASRIEAARLATVALVGAGRTPPDPASLADVDLPVSLVQQGTGKRLSPAATVGPGMALLFLFLSVSFVARAVLEERRTRVLDRIRAAPVPLSAVLLGKCLGLVMTSFLSVLVLWGMTTAFLDARWGDPAGVLLLTLASSLAVAGVAGIVAAVSDAEQTADQLATMVGFVFGILGGSLVPLSQLPPSLLRLSLGTPNGWALRGFAELSAGQGAVGDVVPHVLVLLAWAIVSGGIAIVALPRRLGTR